jgi:hypothetical protein
MAFCRDPMLHIYLDSSKFVNRELLREALAILEFRDAPDCEIARVAYTLSCALLMSSPNDEEGLQKRQWAEKVRKALQNTAYDLEKHSEDAYDAIVDASMR